MGREDVDKKEGGEGNGVGADAESDADSVFLTPEYFSHIHAAQARKQSPSECVNDRRDVIDKLNRPMTPKESAAIYELIRPHDIVDSIREAIGKALGVDMGKATKPTFRPFIDVIDMNNDKRKEGESENPPAQAVLVGIKGTF